MKDLRVRELFVYLYVFMCVCTICRDVKLCYVAGGHRGPRRSVANEDTPWVRFYNIYIYIYIYIYTYIYTYIFTYIYKQLYIYIYIYIYQYLQLYIPLTIYQFHICMGKWKLPYCRARALS